MWLLATILRFAKAAFGRNAEHRQRSQEIKNVEKVIHLEPSQTLVDTVSIVSCFTISL